MSLANLLKNKVIKIQNGFPCGNWNEEGRGFLQIRPFNINDLGQIDLTKTKYIETEKNTNLYKLELNDVIFNNTNSQELVGKASLWTIEINNVVISNHMTIIRVLDKDKAHPKFIALKLLHTYYTGHFKEICRRYVNQANVGKERLINIPFPDFNIEEQKKIASILTLIQEAIAQQEKAIALTTELKKTLMQKLFTEGLNNEPQKMTEIGLIPESWEVLPLEKSGEVVYGIQASVANNIEPIGTKILTNKNITLEGEIDLEKINYFELTTKRHQETILKQGDLLFNWRSGSKDHVGKTAYFNLEGEYTHSSFILRIRPYQEINGKYLFYYLTRLRESNYFVKLQTFSINAKFNKSAVNALPTIVPNKEEQDKIALSIDKVLDKIKQHRKKLVILQDLFRTLLHQLMTAQIRVDELDLTALENKIKE